MDTIHTPHTEENIQNSRGISVSRPEHGVAKSIKNILVGRFASLGIALTGLVACSENVAATHCEISSPHDGTNGDAGSVNSQDSKDTGTDIKSSGVPPTTLPILKHVMSCYSSFHDTSVWCDNFVLSRTPSDPKFCDTYRADTPKNIKDACVKKTQECLSYAYVEAFKDCVKSIPADSSCKKILQPYSMAHDSDQDGLSDHFEIWTSHTNPCEPCSYGDEAPCDAVAPFGTDGLNNKDAQYFFGGCTSEIPTDECG